MPKDCQRTIMISLAFFDITFGIVRIIAIDKTGFCIDAHSYFGSFNVAWNSRCIRRQRREGFRDVGTKLDKLLF